MNDRRKTTKNNNECKREEKEGQEEVGMKE
jgi:hypothetical protein